MLVALKLRIAPTSMARDVELIRQYQDLKRAPRAEQVDAWLQRWERSYTDRDEVGAV